MGLRLAKYNDVKTLEKGTNSHHKAVILTQNSEFEDVGRDIVCGKKWALKGKEENYVKQNCRWKWEKNGEQKWQMVWGGEQTEEGR